VWATLTGSGLQSAGAELAAAVAVLSEHQVTTENPAALAEVAVGLTNAGRILLEVARIEDWSKARRMLADAAWNLAVAGAAVGSTLLVADSQGALTTAAYALEDAAALVLETEGHGDGGVGGDAVIVEHLLSAGAAFRATAQVLDEAAAELAKAGPYSSSAMAAQHVAAAREGLTTAGLGMMDTSRCRIQSCLIRYSENPNKVHFGGRVVEQKVYGHLWSLTFFQSKFLKLKE